VNIVDSVKEMFKDKMNDIMNEVEELMVGRDIEDLVINKEIGERFLDSVVKLIGYRYLYYYTENPDKDPLGLVRMIVPGIELFKKEEASKESKIVDFPLKKSKPSKNKK